MSDPKPSGTGWARQRARWRLTRSVPLPLAHKLGQEAEALGIPPAVLVTTLVGRHYATKEPR